MSGLFDYPVSPIPQTIKVCSVCIACSDGRGEKKRKNRGRSIRDTPVRYTLARPSDFEAIIFRGR